MALMRSNSRHKIDIYEFMTEMSPSHKNTNLTQQMPEILEKGLYNGMIGQINDLFNEYASYSDFHQKTVMTQSQFNQMLKDCGLRSTHNTLIFNETISKIKQKHVES